MSAFDLTNDDRASSAAPIGALRQFARKREPTRAPVEHCELCNDVIAADHRHLLDLAPTGSGKVEGRERAAELGIAGLGRARRSLLDVESRLPPVGGQHR